MVTAAPRVVETLVAHDTFTDAIDTPLASHAPDLGAGWTAFDADWKISGTNSLQVNAAARGLALNGTTLPGDQAAEVQILVGPFSVVGPVVRWTGDGNGTGYALLGAMTGVHLARFNGGGSADDLHFEGASYVGEVLKLVAVGDRLTVLQDGVELYSFTDDTYASGRTGLMAWTNGGSIPQFEHFRAYRIDPDDGGGDGGNGEPPVAVPLRAPDVICARLLAIPAVVAIVGDRVHQLILPQKGQMPAIRVQGIDRNDPMHLRGTVGWITARVQVDHYAERTNGGDPLATARAMAAAAHGQFVDGKANGLAGWRGIIGDPPTRVDQIRLVDEREEFNAAELDEVRIMQDYIVNFREGA